MVSSLLPNHWVDGGWCGLWLCHNPYQAMTASQAQLARLTTSVVGPRAHCPQCTGLEGGLGLPQQTAQTQPCQTLPRQAGARTLRPCSEV